MADLQAVVINYQTAEDLGAFLRSFHAIRDEIDCTLSVVNVCPLPEDLAVARDAEGSYAGDTSWSWQENVGYNRAANHAVRLGRSPYAAVFNADVELRPGVLIECVKALEAHPRWAVVGPRQVDEHNRITSAGTFGTVDDPKMRGWYEYDRGQFNDVREDAVHVSGAAMFWRRSAWDELASCPIYRQIAPAADGALLGSVFHYYGETWAMAHALSHDWLVAYLGMTSLVHKWHRSSPVGGEVERRMPEEQAEFRRACQIHRCSS